MRVQVAPIAFATNTWHSLLELQSTDPNAPSAWTTVETVSAAGGDGDGSYSSGALGYSGPWLWSDAQFRVAAYNDEGFSAYSAPYPYSAPITFPPPVGSEGGDITYAPPTGLTASVDTATNTVNLTWSYTPAANDGPGALGFAVYQIDGVMANPVASYLPDFPADLEYDPGTQTYSFAAPLAPGQTAQYAVGAVSAFWGAPADQRSSALSNVVTAANQSGLPQAPSQVIATPLSDTTIQLTWDDPNDGQASYQVERMVMGRDGSGGSYQVRATLLPGTGFSAGGTVTFDDTVTPGLNDQYQVMAINSAGDSPYTPSTPQPVMPLPTAPSNVSAQVVSFSQVNVYWQANAVNATGEEVQWATDAGFENIVGTAVVGAEAEEYTVNNLVVGTTYYFRVWADNSSGESAIAGPISTAITGPTLSTASLTLEVNDQGDSGNWMMGDLTGFDGDGSAALDPDSVGGNLRFVELTATIPGWMDLATTAFALDYTGTGFTSDDPSGLRVWDSDNAARNESDYIAPGEEESVTALTDSGTSRTIDFWVDAMSSGDENVTLTLVANSGGNSGDDADAQPAQTQPATNTATAPATTQSQPAPLGPAPILTTFSPTSAGTPMNNITLQIPSAGVAGNLKPQARLAVYQNVEGDQKNGIVEIAVGFLGSGPYPQQANYGFVQFMSGYLTTSAAASPIKGTIKHEITGSKEATGTTEYALVPLRSTQSPNAGTAWYPDAAYTPGTGKIPNPYYQGWQSRSVPQALAMFDLPNVPYVDLKDPNGTPLINLHGGQTATLVLTYQTYLVCGGAPVAVVQWSETLTYNKINGHYIPTGTFNLEQIKTVTQFLPLEQEILTNGLPKDLAQ